MAERTVTVASKIGLHARPASLFSRAASQCPVTVTARNSAGKTVNAASILGILSLGVEHGDSLTLSAEGEGAEAAIDVLARLLESELDQE